MTAAAADREAVERVRAIVDRAAVNGQHHATVGNALAFADLRVVLDEREQLVARVAELEAHPAMLLAADAAEREDDTLAVRDALIALDVLRVSLPGPAQRRVAKLHARFADRIAELGQQDAAAASPACLLCDCPGCPQCSTADRAAAFERAIGHELDGHGAVCFCYLTRQRDGQDDAADGSAR